MKRPDGGGVRRYGSFPQQTTAPSSRSAQLWYSPALIWTNWSGGASVLAKALFPQQPTLPSVRSARTYSAPALNWLSWPDSASIRGSCQRPQQAISPSSRSAQTHDRAGAELAETARRYQRLAEMVSAPVGDLAVQAQRTTVGSTGADLTEAPGRRIGLAVTRKHPIARPVLIVVLFALRLTRPQQTTLASVPSAQLWY